MTPAKLWALDRFYASRLLRRLYMGRQRRRAARALAQGAPLGAAEHLLRGWKHAGGELLGPSGERLWRSLLELARGPDGALKTARENPFRAAAALGPQGVAQRARFAGYPLEDRVRLRTPKPEAPPARQGDLLLLKQPGPDPADGSQREPGVLLVTYHHGIEYLPLVFDLGALGGRFTLVLEPSTWGYMDALLLPYLGRDLDVLVEAQSQPDHDWVAGLGANLVPSPLGAGDWADPALFAPREGAARTYDVCMVAAWDPLKRHGLLFDALAALKRRGRPLRTALVGYRLDGTREQVERLARAKGVAELVTLFDKVPHAEVARLLADARVSLLLSKREGANRALYESWFCNTPTVVYRHHRGVNLAHAGRSEVGLLADDHELPDALLAVVDHPERFAPRAWALKHTGCHVATQRLEGALAGLAARRGQPFTHGLAVRHAAGYLHEADRLRLTAATTALAGFLLPA